jgi:tetratricopeptide (TPR) repeat protein
MRKEAPIHAAPLAAALAAALATASSCAGAPAPDPGADRAPAVAAPVEATSFRGEPLERPAFPREHAAQLEADLAAAEAALAAAPEDEDAWIWVGRRLAYLGRYRDAIDAYTRGLELHPESYRLLRHRGHRWITVRELARAEADLARAAELVAGLPDEVEPDGAPNAAGVPTGTTQTNVHYHLGLARYLQGDHAGALDAYRDCMLAARSLDTKIATAYWTYLTLMRLERRDEAARILAGVTPELPLLENHAYHALLLHFAGERGTDDVMRDVEPGSVDHATRAYGLASAALFAGAPDAEVDARLRDALATGAWAAFGCIAAEAEAARRGIEVREPSAPSTPR